ncbi:MAG TPA: hypothetical protein VKU19_02335 [Bryobacteraceae bacterium]|nr:hypothetical protein [Bryobacteraceae bacterium]
MFKTIATLFLGTAAAVIPALAVDGTVLINQSSVMAAGGFPFTITQSGSYKLSSNLQVPEGVNGININANDVTLDLNGFMILGAITCGNSSNSCGPVPRNAVHGISALAVGITIRNGHVRGFSRGVKIFGGLVEEMHVSGNLIDGIEGNDSVIRRNDASLNAGIGIQCFNCVVSENVATLNASNGFNLGGGGVFSANSMKSSLGQGLEITQLVVTTHNNSCDGFPCL